MNSFFTAWNAWLGRRMFLIVLLGLLLGFLFPVADSPLFRFAVIALFAYMTFITALGTSLKQFFHILGRPLVPTWILVLIHVVSPIFAWAAGWIFYPNDPLIRLGYMIAASVPIGVTSIIWTSLMGGNPAIGLVSVTLDTLIVPVLLPVYFSIVAGQIVHIDYVQMAIQLLWMITIPSVAGMLIHDATHGKSDNFAKGFGGFVSKLAFFLVIYLNAALVGPEIEWSLTVLKIALVTLLLVASGYYMGYLGSLAVPKRSRDVTISMIFNVGLRNISTGLVLALAYFPPASTVVVTMYILFQQPLAALVPYLYRRKDEAESPA